MSWTVNNNDFEIRMTEMDFGIKLPLELQDFTITQSDMFKFVIKDAPNGNVILDKDFANISQNTINIELTEQETIKLTVGVYYYYLDWYQDHVFRDCIIEAARFKVGDKV